MIKALIFDMGGVLIDLDVDGCKKTFRTLLDYDNIDNLLDLWHQKGIYSDLEEGKISENEFRDLVLKDSKPGGSYEDVDNSLWALLSSLAPYKVDMLKRLKTKYDIYMLSNVNGISIKKCEKLFCDAGAPMDTIFKSLFLSYQMKLQKPEPEIFKKTIYITGLDASEILFVDDSINNVEVARSFGINAVHYVQGENLESALKAVLGEF